MCPSDDDLSCYLAGSVDVDVAREIAGHVATCRMCEALVEVLGSRPLAEASSSAEPRAGDSVGGYVLQGRLGAGGMGIVWEAYDPDLDRPVAVKLMRDAAAPMRARFEREVQITARLQHPSIVNIFEAGVWRGEPYYVMKLVRGESLERRLAGRATLAERLALVPAVIAVVDAVAYAHGAGVIHRDLKPDNVLVGEFGESVVIDWGLAKPLASRDSEPDVAGALADGTAAGAVIGTPAYMSPEQARGEAVGAAADVYALGAILYAVLAGARPYAGAGDVVAAVVAGPPAPLADVPPELATIVARAMAREPADRYATARELADELKRFQTGQLVASHRYSARERLARWVRRHRAAVVVGAIAVATLAITGAIAVTRIVDEKQQATDAQLRAEAHRRDAERLLAFMLVDLRAQLAPLGKIAVVENILREAEDYFAHADADPHVRFDAAIALGELHAQRGEGGPSLARFEDAERLARAEMALDPSWRHEVADAELHVGTMLMGRGDLANALARFHDGVSRVPSDDALAAGLHDAIGGVLASRGDVTAAAAEYRIAVAGREALVGAIPADGARQHELAIAHVKLADMLRAHGELAAAIDQQRAAVAIMQKLVDASPDATAYLRDLGVYRGRLGTMIGDGGDHAAGVAEDRAGLAALERAAAREPRDAQIRGYLASALIYVAEDVEPAEAFPLCERALALRYRQLEDDPGDLDARAHAAAAEQELAATLKRLGRLPDALAHARASVALGEELVARTPDNRESQSWLGGDEGTLGDVLAAMGKRDEAIAAYRTSLANAETLVALDPKRVDWQRDVADRHASIADAIAQADPTAAVPEYRAALAIVERLAAADPTNGEWTGLAKELRSHLR